MRFTTLAALASCIVAAHAHTHVWGVWVNGVFQCVLPDKCIVHYSLTLLNITGEMGGTGTFVLLQTTT